MTRLVVTFILIISGILPVTVAFAADSAVVAEKTSTAKPNFVFVIGDDCTHRDLGCYGGQAITPNIDQLANDGMRFTHCFQAAPMCSPTRHNIYTGLYPVRSGAYPNHTFAKDGTKSICHYLKPLGYRVALSGKTHISPKEVFPFEYSGMGDMTNIDQMMTECAETDTPFCLFACSNEPHTPWNKGDASQYDPKTIELPPYFVDTPETRFAFCNYMAEVTYLDGQLGQILDLLDKHNLADNTMVIFTSEQGNSFPFAKWTCYDNGLQTAFVVRWPEHVKPGSVSDAMIEYVDVAPTFIDAAGGRPAKVLEGKSIVPVLEGKTDQHKEFVYGIHTTRGIINGSDQFGIRSVRSREFKYIRNLTPEIKFENAVTGQLKKASIAGGGRDSFYTSWHRKAETDPEAAELVRKYEHRPAEELFDKKNDPLELNNLADNPEYAEVKQQLSKKLDQWMQWQGDEGIQTEIEAPEHQGRNRKKK